MNEPKDEANFWFPAKRYGWGWGVANCWQGLLIQVGYVVLVLLGARILLPSGHRREFWALLIVSTVSFVAIHWLKGEKPLAWRWGK